MGKKLTDSTTTMSEKVCLDKLQLGKNKETIVVRLLRMWEARNFKLNGTLMSLDLLLLDEKDNLIQGSIHHRRIHIFKDLLEEGNVYHISDFEVVPSYTHYKVSDNPLTIRLMDTTQIKDVEEVDCCIQLHKFRIHGYAEIQNFVGTNLHLLDVVGQVLQIQGSNLDDSNSNQKIMLVLLLEENITIRVTLWDEQASEFRKKYQQTDKNCSVIVVTSLNPKMFAGKLHLNSSGSTKVYINYNLKVVKEFMRSMGIENTSASAKIVEQETTKLSMEIWTIEQIFQYISSGHIQEKEVICHGTIVDICSRNGWNYLSCASCSKKFGRSATALICNQCNKTTTIGVARFRIELIVESGDRTTTFVLFDRDAKNLIHTTAEDIIASQEKEEDSISNNQILPKCFLEMIGKTMNFQVKISEYNFKTSTQSFTVTRILKDQSLPQSEDNNKLAKPSSPKDQTEDVSDEKDQTEDGNNNQTDEEKEPKKRRFM